MTAQGGFGLDLTLNGTTIVGVEDVDEVSFMKFIAETTAHDSPGGYYEATPSGKRRIEPLSVVMFWDVGEATHAAVLAAFNADTASQFSWSDPDGEESIEFNAHVERIGRISQQEDAYRANVDLHPSGTATIT